MKIAQLAQTITIQELTQLRADLNAENKELLRRKQQEFESKPFAVYILATSDCNEITYPISRSPKP
jgi:hypothetical protein